MGRGEEGREDVCTGFLVWKPEGKGPHGGNSHRYEDNIKMNLQKVGYEPDRAGYGEEHL